MAAVDRIKFQRFQHIQPAHFRRQQIQRNQIRQLFARQAQAFFAGRLRW
jgi:hypothetical protein